ncbi:MAG: tRNA pseudouridine(55) synthase TruB [Burkholderiales bacterium]
MSSSGPGLRKSERSTDFRAPRIVRRAISGVVLLDKPAGLSSSAACQRVKRLYRAESAGHTGTLDPFATGLLPIALGEATKFSSGLLGADKTYETHARLGIRTDTGDLDGAVVAERPTTHDAAALAAALARLAAAVLQVPPMYSALKRDGRPLYEYARAGLVVERAARPMTIHSLDLLSATESALHLRIRCSKGTYIRTLIDDLGEMLGCGAHLTALRRTAIGSIDLGRARALGDIEILGEDALDRLLDPPDSLVGTYPAIALDDTATSKLVLGQTVSTEPPILGKSVLMRAYDPTGKFLGVVQRQDDGRIKPERLVRTGV